MKKFTCTKLGDVIIFLFFVCIFLPIELTAAPVRIEWKKIQINVQVSSLLADEKNLWLGTLNGIYQLRMSETLPVKISEMSTGTLGDFTFIKDPSGDKLWILHYRSVCYFDIKNGDTRCYTSKDGIDFGDAGMSIGWMGGALLLGCEDFALQYLDRKTDRWIKWHRRLPVGFMGPKDVSCILMANDRLWIGTWWGLYAYNHSNEIWTTIRFPEAATAEKTLG